MRKISKNTINEIRNLSASGHSTREVALATGISHMTVNNYLVSLGVSRRKPTYNGRPRKLSERHIRHIVRQFELGIFRNAREACNQVMKDTGISVQKTTIARILRRRP